MTTVGTSSTPQLSIRDSIATLTLNRPQHRNRIENADLNSLKRDFEQINSNHDIRVLILRATIPSDSGKQPVFSAGYHIGDYDNSRPAVLFEHIADALENLRPVTLCALSGSVFGGATDLVLACDFVIAAEGVEMRMPAAAIGLHYYAGGLSRYVSRLGIAMAKKAFLMAEPFSTAELLQMGYVHQAVPAASLDDVVASRARHIAGLAPLAVQSLKASLNEIARGDFDHDRLLARELMTQATDDFAEGRRAFAERRAPAFRGH